MKTKCVNVFIAILLAGAINVQAHNSDSLRQALAALPLTEQISLLKEVISGEEIAKNFKMRIDYTDMLDSLAGHLPTATERAAAYLSAGRFYYNVSCYEPAERVLYRAQQEVETLSGKENEALLADIIFARGQNLMKMSDFVNATQLLTEAGSYFDKEKDYAKLIKVYTTQVVVYQAQIVTCQTDESRAILQERENYFLKKMEEMYPEIEDPVLRADCLTSMANYEINKRDWEKAKEYLALLGAISRDCNYTDGLIAYYGNSGLVEEKMGNIREGMALQYKVYEIAIEAGNMAYAAQALANAAFNACKIEDDELIRRYSLKGMELAREYGIKAQLWRFLDNLSALAYREKNYKQAYDYHEECVDIYMELYSENNANQINQYAARFESLQKENKINELQAEAEVYLYKTRQKNQLIFFLALAIGMAILILALLWFLLRLRNRRNRELAEMNLTKDKFFNIISHDLRNPAIAQRDALQTLINNVHKWNTDDMMEFCLELLKSAEGEVELLFNLLSWSQLQTGRMAYAPETFLLSDLLPSLTLLQKMAESKDITLNINIPENELITCDVNILTTVIRNLLVNAIKFTEPDGTVTLDISCKGVSQYAPTIISITDTGIGMTENQLRNIFRLDTSHSQQGTAGEQGSGLGLILCKDLLEEHGSKLLVESKEGEGSRFWFVIKN